MNKHNTALPKICVVGCGYIGLPTIAMFAKCGCSVVGVDKIPSIIDKLNQGLVHIEEPGLAEIIRQVTDDKLFHASSSPEEADVYIIAVPTPNRSDEYLSCDLTYVLDAAQSIVPYLRKGNAVIIESTIAPRSTDDYIKPIFESAGFAIGEDLFLAHCPERVLPGKILYELTHNNRIVGGVTPRCSDQIAKIYGIFVEGEIIKAEAKTAEMSKCMENTFRDVNIALANELAKICDALKINCLDVIALANKHPRVNIHSPGPGVGGHCLAIDPYFISAEAPEIAKIIRLSRDTNNSMPEFVADKVDALLNGIENPSIAVLGVTYKGNIDDKRESPALEIIERLSRKYKVMIVDDHVNELEFLSLNEAIPKADLTLVLTDHDEFKGELLHRYLRLMKRPVVFDTKNIVAEGDGIWVVNYGNMWGNTLASKDSR